MYAEEVLISIFSHALFLVNRLPDMFTPFLAILWRSFCRNIFLYRPFCLSVLVIYKRESTSAVYFVRPSFCSLEHLLYCLYYMRNINLIYFLPHDPSCLSVCLSIGRSVCLSHFPERAGSCTSMLLLEHLFKSASVIS